MPLLDVAEGLLRPADPSRFGKVRTRRFAGPAIHAERLTKTIRVAHLTDLHVGRVTPLRIQEEAVRLTNAEKPDLVVVTGDFVCHSQKYLDELGYVIGALEGPVVCVLGNHDYWSGADEVVRTLERQSALVLRNANTVIELGGQRLQLVGVDDAYTGHGDVERATKGMRSDVPTLGLSHIAEEADALFAHGVPLVLSGHTHAGQITLARLHELALGRLVGHKYMHGLYGTRRGDGAVYVGAGLGAAVMPLRLGARTQREVTIFELGQSPGAFLEDHEEQVALPGRKPSEKTQFKRMLEVERKRLKRERSR
ncbi:hypothetical protein BH09MYX1_BH09MYX1_39640 [soil metagenome]